MSSQTQPFFAPEADPDLKRLPKCNLHTHLEGSIRPATLWALAGEQGVDLGIPADSVDDALGVTGEEQSLVDYLNKISLTYPVLKNPAALRRTAFEAAEDAARDGNIYFELRAGPVTHSTPDLPVEHVIHSILEGLREAEAAYGMVCRFIVAALRHHDPADNVRLAHAALEFRGEGVVGFDLAGDEANYPAQLHAEAFRVAREGGLGITVHAGEAAGAENVKYAVQELGATRIGHGVHSVESGDVLGMLQTERILLEVCPTSNVHTHAVAGITRHPVRLLYDRDIPISIGDDDPTTSRTRVSRELTLLRQRFDFTQPELADIQQQGLEAAFLTDAGQRARLIEAVRTAWD